jgi:hypothetical protein
LFSRVKRLHRELQQRDIDPGKFIQWLIDEINFFTITFKLDNERKKELAEYAESLLDRQKQEKIKDIDSWN